MAYCRAKARLARAESAYDGAFEAALDAFRRERRDLFDELLAAKDALEAAERRLTAAEETRPLATQRTADEAGD
jgi:outer membrane protein TolC